MERPSHLDLVADRNSSAPTTPRPAVRAPGRGFATPHGTSINQAGLLLRAEGAKPRNFGRTLGIMAANGCRHRDMDFAFTGNADRDFVAGMIPHHQAAMETARIMLQHGADPEVRRAGGGHHHQQEREIARMQAILQRLPTR